MQENPPLESPGKVISGDSPGEVSPGESPGEVSPVESPGISTAEEIPDYVAPTEPVNMDTYQKDYIYDICKILGPEYVDINNFENLFEKNYSGLFYSGTKNNKRIRYLAAFAHKGATKMTKDEVSGAIETQKYNELIKMCDKEIKNSQEYYLIPTDDDEDEEEDYIEDVKKQ
jgi:hypothetical protein